MCSEYPTNETKTKIEKPAKQTPAQNRLQNKQTVGGKTNERIVQNKIPKTQKHLTY